MGEGGELHILTGDSKNKILGPTPYMHFSIKGIFSDSYKDYFTLSIHFYSHRG